MPIETMSEFKDNLADAATSLSEGASDVAEDLRNHAEDAWHSVQHRARRAIRAGSSYVRKNPARAALATFAMGLALGLILRRHEPESFKDRYLSKPLRKSKGVLNGLRNVMVVALSLFTLLPLPAASGASEISGGTFSIYMENDLFAGTDRQYTSGVKFGWSSADLDNFSDSPYASPFLPLFNLLPFINEKAYQKNLLFALGQNIYTPDDTEAFDLVKGDRPYAGWLHLGVGAVWKNADVRNSLVLNIGVVGSWSYAQEAQRLVHDARGLGHPNGWDNQLHNELGVIATYERKWRWPKHEQRVGFDWEFLPHAGVALGNVQTYANLGGELRAGLNLPDDFGTAAISPAAPTSTPVDGREGAERSRFDLGFYVFARADGRVVAHNIFLDGNTFGDSPSVDRKWLVADLSVGAAVNYKNTKIAYAFVYRTEEYHGQREAQIFGTVSVNVTF